jgi:uncharacterized protein
MNLSRLALSLLLVLCAASPTLAQDRPPWIVTVTGEGTATAVPDLVEIRAGVVTQGKTAREASEANGRAMAALLLVLKANGVAETDVQTSRFFVQPVYETNRNPPQRITGFQVANQVAVKVRDTAVVGDLVDKLAGAGANEFSGISFHVSGASKLLDTAREEAIADARRKADIYARAAGLALGRAIAIVEDGAVVPAMARSAAMAPGATPIAPGEQQLRVSVSVTFELLR